MCLILEQISKVWVLFINEIMSEKQQDKKLTLQEIKAIKTDKKKLVQTQQVINK